jgi:hypothetical protein
MAGGLLRTMSVSIVPGAIAFTRILRGASSAASARVYASRPAFAAAYMWVCAENR